jgi:hypothetical protein
MRRTHWRDACSRSIHVAPKRDVDPELIAMNYAQPSVQEPPESAEYEFGDDDNQTFRDLASALKFVGITSIAFGLLASIVLLREDLLHILMAGIQATLSVVVGGWLYSASTSVERIVATQGSDITNLMAAMRELKKVYSLQRVLYAIAIVLFAIALAVALVS